MPSVSVRYSDYRLSPSPVHVTRSDFQRFVPDAVAAGWFPAGPSPVIALDLVTDDFLASDPPTGFMQGASLIPYLNAHLARLSLLCDSGDYHFNVSYRSGTAVVHLDLQQHLDAEGLITFGFALASGFLVVCMFTSESAEPRAHIYIQVTSVIDVSLVGPLRPSSQYIGVNRVSYLVPRVVSAPRFSFH
jgi:hypothetical protein